MKSQGAILDFTGNELKNFPTIEDTNGYVSIDSENRILEDSSGLTSLDWGNRIAYDTSDYASIDWDQKIGYAYAGTLPTLGWGDTGVFIGDITSGEGLGINVSAGYCHVGDHVTVDWYNGTLNSGYIASLDWGNRYLQASNGTRTLDWEDGFLTNPVNNMLVLNLTTYQLFSDDSGYASVDFRGRYLSHPGGARTIDWWDGIANDIFTVKSIDWTNRTGFDSDGTGSLDWNSRGLYNSADNISVDWENYTLSSNGGTRFDWGNGCIYAIGDGSLSIRWTDRELREPGGNVTVYWGISELRTIGGATALDWENNLMNDFSNILSLDWNGRNLLDTTGTAVVDWSGTNAALEVISTTKAFLPPRMTSTEKNAISSPAAGSIVFDTTLNNLCVYGVSSWETINAATEAIAAGTVTSDYTLQFEKKKFITIDIGASLNILLDSTDAEILGTILMKATGAEPSFSSEYIKLSGNWDLSLTNYIRFLYLSSSEVHYEIYQL